MSFSIEDFLVEIYIKPLYFIELPVNKISKESQMNIVQEFDKETVNALSEGKNFPEFAPGDTVRVHVKIKEGNNERIQAYEGVCIARSQRSIGSSFTVRKISYGTGVERVFPLYSPLIDKVEVIKRGIVRQSKLYYMRQLSGKSARIKEKLDFVSKKNQNKDAKKTSDSEKAQDS